jgi:bacterial/archaeal transporter family protein
MWPRLPGQRNGPVEAIVFMGLARRCRPGSIDKLSVVLVAIFATVFLGERPSLPNWLGIFLIVAGAALITSRS